MSIAVCDNPTMCILNRRECAHVETGQTSEKRVAVVQMTTDQGIC